MKLGVYSVCLPDQDPDSAIDLVRSAGYAGIEWRVSDAPFDSARTPDFFTNNRCTLAAEPIQLQLAARRCRDVGLEVIGLNPYIATGDLNAVRVMMELAGEMGAPWIRMRAPWRSEGRVQDLEAVTTEFFAGIAVLAERVGVKALLELHQRSTCTSASAAHRLVSRFDPAHIGVIYDAGNLILEGYEDHQFATELLGDYLAHVHIKNAAFERPAGGGIWQPRWTPLDDGELDLPKLLDALDLVGYDGWISVEDFSTVRSPADTLRFNSTLLREFGDRHGDAPLWEVS